MTDLKAAANSPVLVEHGIQDRRDWQGLVCSIQCSSNAPFPICTNSDFGQTNSPPVPQFSYP